MIGPNRGLTRRRVKIFLFEDQLGNQNVNKKRHFASVLYKEYLVGEMYELIGDKIHQKLEPSLCPFKHDEDGRLYYRGKPITNRNGELKMVGVIADTLDIRGL